MRVSKRLAQDLERAVEALPEILEREDLQNNLWLCRLILAADALDSKISRADRDYLKTGAYERDHGSRQERAE